jgi:hypothetical protein
VIAYRANQAFHDCRVEDKYSAVIPFDREASVLSEMQGVAGKGVVRA